MRITKYTKEGLFLSSYNTIVEAAHQNNITATNIGRTIDGKRMSAGGFQWRKIDSLEDISPISKRLKGEEILQIDKESKQILNTFESAVAAASHLNVKSTSAIAACASHQILPSGYSRETAYGYIWEWKDKKVPPRRVRTIEEKTEDEIVLYRRWIGIKQRCYNKNDTAYYLYGNQGVTMCDEWLNSFEAFKEWALLNGFKKELEIDKDILCEELDIYPKIYSPETCKWVTRQENILQQNREKTSKIVYQYTLNGELLAEYKSISAAATKTNVHHRAIAGIAKRQKGTAGGFQWRFTREDSIKKHRTTTKSIKQIDNNTKEIIAIYEHIDDAVTSVQGTRNPIYSACNGYRKRAYGYIWEYV